MQYLTPIGQFVIGTLVYSEYVGPMNGWRRVGVVRRYVGDHRYCPFNDLEGSYTGSFCRRYWMRVPSDRFG